MPDLGGLPGWVALVVAGIGAWNSLRKVRIDERGGVVAELNGLIEQLKAEIARVNERGKEREADMQKQVDAVQGELTTSRSECQRQIASLQDRIGEQDETIRRQAIQITQLERRKTPRINGGGGTAP